MNTSSSSVPRVMRVSAPRGWSKYPLMLLAATLIALGTGAHAAPLLSDSAYYLDEFSGTSLGSGWTPIINAAGTITVGGGNVTINSIGLDPFSDDVYMYTNNSPVNVGSATEYVTEIKFNVATGGTLSTSTPREMILLEGMATPNGANDGFYISLLQGSAASQFSLGWGGFGSISSPVQLLNTATTDLSRGTDYVLSMYRQSNNEIAFYLDGVLLTGARTALGTGNYTDFRLGDISGEIQGLYSVEYISVGNLIPEPSSTALLCLGVKLGWVLSRGARECACVRALLRDRPSDEEAVGILPQSGRISRWESPSAV